MRLSDLQAKDIVSNEGKIVGKIIDAEIDSSGKLQYLVVEAKKMFRGFNNKETNVSFDQIVKIGEDVILVDIK